MSTGDESRTASEPGRLAYGGPLWVWPAVVIALVAVLGVLFGSDIALIIAGQVLAITVFAVAKQLGGNQWLAAVIALLVSGVLVLAGMAQLGQGFTFAPFRGITGASGSTRTESPANGDLRNRDLTQQDVRSIDFRRVDLAGANLDGLDLRGRNFDGVDASGTSFRGSDLSGASLRGTILSGACLRGAHLQGADLTGADVSSADIAGATVPPGAAKAAGSWPSADATSTACQ